MCSSKQGIENQVSKALVRDNGGFLHFGGWTGQIGMRQSVCRITKYQACISENLEYALAVESSSDELD